MFQLGFRLHRLACALLYTSVLLAGSLTAQRAPPYTSGWWDVAAIAGGAVVAGGGAITRPPVSACAPCDPAELPAIDRGVLPWHSGFARGTSDVLVLGVAAGAMLGATWRLPANRARGDAVVLANALTWTAAATEWIKVAAHRARPALYRDGAPQAATKAGNRKSFPSGHTAIAFAAATTYTTLALRQQLPHARRNAVLLFAGAAIVGSLRVAGGRHFPTDVLAGAALGSGVGWLTARLHPVRP